MATSDSRVILRRLVVTDAAPICAALQEWDVVKNLARVPWPYGMDDARAFITKAGERWASDEEYIFAVDDGDLVSRLVGMIGVHDIREGSAEIGYWFAKSSWGRGYATAAIAAMVDYGFGQLGLDAITAGVVTDNPASMWVLEKNGFVRSGSKTCATLSRGELPAVACRITRSHWQARGTERNERASA